jgi:hypothetical protein
MKINQEFLTKEDKAVKSEKKEDEKASSSGATE